MTMNLFHDKISEHLTNIVENLGDAYTRAVDSGIPVIPRLSNSSSSVVREWDSEVANWPSPNPNYEMDHNDYQILYHDPNGHHVHQYTYEGKFMGTSQAQP